MVTGVAGVLWVCKGEVRCWVELWGMECNGDGV